MGLIFSDGKGNAIKPAGMYYADGKGNATKIFRNFVPVGKVLWQGPKAFTTVKSTDGKLDSRLVMNQPIELGVRLSNLKTGLKIHLSQVLSHVVYNDTWVTDKFGSTATGPGDQVTLSLTPGDYSVTLDGSSQVQLVNARQAMRDLRGSGFPDKGPILYVKPSSDTAISVISSSMMDVSRGFPEFTTAINSSMIAENPKSWDSWLMIDSITAY